MDTKRLIAVIVLTTTLMLLWMIGVPWLGRQLGYDMTARPAEQTPQTDPTPAERTDPLAAGPSTGPATMPTTGPSTQPAAGTSLAVLTSAEPQTLTLGSDDPSGGKYALAVQLNNVGAGIDEVVLNQFRVTAESPERYRFQQPYPEQPDATRPLATNTVQLLGQTVDLSRAAWAVDEAETGPEQATFYVDVGTAAGPVARVVKVIRLYPRYLEDGTPDPRGGYELLVRQTIQNLTDQPLTVQTAINGPTTPPRELEYGYDRMIVAGYRGRNGTIEYEAWTVEQFTDEEQRRELITSDMPPLLWAGASSIYFNAIVRPLPIGQEQQPQDSGGGVVPAPEYLRQVVAASVNPEVEDDRQRHVAMRFFTNDLAVPAGGSVQLPFRVFFGPKERSLLKDDYYGSAAMRYDETLVSPFGCTWCVFQPVVDVLVWLLSAFHTVLRDWGLAIIVLVVVVRLLLHPITKRSQRSMMRMAKLGPEMEKIKKKYGDDKEAMAKAMQEFYREHGMAALPLGCLPMLLQTPIWIALYSTLQAEIRLRHEPFLYGWTWIEDLAKPDRLIDFGTTINLFLFTIEGINILPILMALVFYFQMKFQPQPAATTPEMQAQQNIMKWMMVLMFPLFLYKAPSGLNLYILTSTVIGIWESKRIRDQFKAEDEAKAAAQPTLVKDKAPRSARAKRRDDGDQSPPPPSGWRGKLAQFQGNLQKQIEQAQKDAAKRQQERKR